MPVAALRKIAEFTILTIFRYRSLRILQFVLPFVILITTHRQSGAPDLTKFAKIADFANLTILYLLLL